MASEPMPNEVSAMRTLTPTLAQAPTRSVLGQMIQSLASPVGGGTLVRWFDSLTKHDTPVAGGKGANLGEMTRAGLPVPGGFVVTVDSYRRFYEASGLASEITARIQSLEIDNPDRLRSGANALQRLIRLAPLPGDVRTAIVTALHAHARREERRDRARSARRRPRERPRAGRGNAPTSRRARAGPGESGR